MAMPPGRLSLVLAALLVSPLWAESPVPKAEESYDNIKVFRGLAYDVLIPSMQLFSDSLGVECTFCHDAQRKDLDVKPAKEVARRMIQMVTRMNKEEFGGRAAVTCYTCHQGSALPNGTRFREQIRHTANVSADQILKNYWAAVGDQSSFRTRYESGSVKVEQPGLAAFSQPIEIYSKAPDKRLTVHFSATHLGISNEAFGIENGNASWLREGHSEVRYATPARLDGAILEDTFNLPRRFKDFVRDVSVDGVGSVEGRDMNIVTGRTRSLAAVRLYFDQESGLLARLVYDTDTIAGVMPTDILYSDYRSVDGVKVPFRWTVSLVRRIRLTYQLDEVRHNIPIDDEKFSKPKGEIVAR